MFIKQDTKVTTGSTLCTQTIHLEVANIVTHQTMAGCSIWTTNAKLEK
jgi:hypothetical protein